MELFFFISPALCASRWIPSLPALGDANSITSLPSQHHGSRRWEPPAAREEIGA